jgi:hypothetical protein
LRPTARPRAWLDEIRNPGVRGASPSSEPEDAPRGKDRGDRSDVGKNASASKEPDPVSGLWPADGRQPFMPEQLTNACL